MVCTPSPPSHDCFSILMDCSKLYLGECPRCAGVLCIGAVPLSLDGPSCLQAVCVFVSNSSLWIESVPLFPFQFPRDSLCKHSQHSDRCELSLGIHIKISHGSLTLTGLSNNNGYFRSKGGCFSLFKCTLKTDLLVYQLNPRHLYQSLCIWLMILPARSILNRLMKKAVYIVSPSLSYIKTLSTFRNSWDIVKCIVKASYAADGPRRTTCRKRNTRPCNATI